MWKPRPQLSFPFHRGEGKRVCSKNQPLPLRPRRLFQSWRKKHWAAEPVPAQAKRGCDSAPCSCTWDMSPPPTWLPRGRQKGETGAKGWAGAAELRRAWGMRGLGSLKLPWVLRASMGTRGKYRGSPKGEEAGNHCQGHRAVSTPLLAIVTERRARPLCETHH